MANSEVLDITLERVDGDDVRADLALALVQEEVVDVKGGKVQAVMDGGRVLVKVFRTRKGFVCYDALATGDQIHLL